MDRNEAHSPNSRLSEKVNGWVMRGMKGDRSLFKSNSTSVHTLKAANHLLDLTALSISDVSYCRESHYGLK